MKVSKNQKRIDEMKEFEKKIVQKVFQDDYHKSACLKLKDVKSHFENKANELKIYNNAIYLECINMINNFCYNVSSMILGETAERTVFDIMRSCQGYKRIITNLSLVNNGQETEYDELIISTGGLFIVEVKGSKHDKYITEDGFYTDKHGNGNYNIIEKLATKESMLLDEMSVLLPNLGSEHIHELVVFVGKDGAKIANRNDSVVVCSTSNCVKYVEKYNQEPVFSREEIEKIENALLCKDVERIYVPDVNLKELESLIDATIMLIESKTTILTENEKDKQYEIEEEDTWHFDLPSAIVGGAASLVTYLSIKYIINQCKA